MRYVEEENCRDLTEEVPRYQEWFADQQRERVNRMADPNIFVRMKSLIEVSNYSCRQLLGLKTIPEHLSSVKGTIS